MKKIIEFILVLVFMNIGSLTSAIASSHEKSETTAGTATSATAETKTENTEEKKKNPDSGDEEPDCD